MTTLSTIWTVFVVLLSLGLAIAILYLGLAAIGFVLSLPFLIAGGILALIGGVTGTLWVIVQELAFWSFGRLRCLFGLNREAEQRSREGHHRSSSEGGSRTYQQQRQFAQDSNLDAYNILQVSREASAAEIKTAYHKQMSRYHPDKVAHLGDELQAFAEQKAKSIQQAYSTLATR